MGFSLQMIPIKKLNVEEYLKPIIDDLIIDVLQYKDIHLVTKTQNYSFKVFSKYSNILYDMFINKCKEHLNDFTLRDKNFELWCYYTNKDYAKGNKWHNHIRTSTINSVLYLETVKGKGIEFENNGEYLYIEPKDYDFLIFPDFLNHLPRISEDKRRISFNMELRCNENSQDIFAI
tara:strand:+ start:1305 stop:1832 length:528 start_codon:yes stop_codon:yes gene_type:complete